MDSEDVLKEFPVEDLSPHVADYVHRLEERNERANKDAVDAKFRAAEVEGFVCSIADILSEQTGFSIEKYDDGYLFGHKVLSSSKRSAILIMLGMLIDRSKRF